MKRFEITIKPLSGFGTPLKGDTLFGHFCWQAANRPEWLDGGLDAALNAYPEEPFAVFSSAVPKLPGKPDRYLLKRPDLPLHMLFKEKDPGDRVLNYQGLKHRKSKKWMLSSIEKPIALHNSAFLNDREAANAVCPAASDALGKDVDAFEEHGFFQGFDQPHNTINRLTGTTGKGAFAPYSMHNVYYGAGMELAIFVLVHPKWTDIDRVVQALRDIGRFGFGRDASIGMGRFEVASLKEHALSLPKKTDGIYTLAPCLPRGRALADRCRFTPFTRFGRHGDRLAISRNPFKAPVIMADEGAVFLPDLGAPFEKPYVGSAVTGVSKVEPGTVVQGYAPYLPIRLEKSDE